MEKTSSPDQRIREALLKHERLTWEELLRETELSKGALSKHLNRLIEWDRVKVNVDVTKNGRKVTYSGILADKAQIPRAIQQLTQGEPKELEEAWRYLVGFSYQSGYLISQICDRKQAKKVLKDYLDFNMETLTANIMLFINTAFMYSKGYAERARLSKQKQYDVFIKNLREDFVKGFVVPWIESVAFAGFWNQDIAVGKTIESEVYPTWGIERGKKIDLSLIDRMPKP